MVNPTRSFKYRYIVFILSVIVAVLLGQVIISYNHHTQKEYTSLINKAGRQRMMSQRITLTLYRIDKAPLAERDKFIDTLRAYNDDWKSSRLYLVNFCQQEGWTQASRLLKENSANFDPIHQAIQGYLEHQDSIHLSKALQQSNQYSTLYLYMIEDIVNELQSSIAKEQDQLFIGQLALSFLILLILAANFFLIILPGINSLRTSNENLHHSLQELREAKETLQHRVEDLHQLGNALQQGNERNKIFIQQAPHAIAMFDKNVCYIAASQKWIDDYHLNGINLIGKSHYEIFPEIGENWKEIHRKCLAGHIDREEEAKFERADGSVQWIKWDVRPWYISDQSIGGILMFTEDITAKKLKELENKKIEEILLNTNELAKIGTWEFLPEHMTLQLSAVSASILSLSDQRYRWTEFLALFPPSQQDTLRKVIKNGLTSHDSFDLKLALASPANAWIRMVGRTDLSTGKALKLSGIIQDISSLKKASREIEILNHQLSAIFNSGMVSIIGTDTQGLINFFNHGAEVLLQYQAAEIIGKNTPEILHVREELFHRGLELSEELGYEVSGFDIFIEKVKQNAFESRQWTYIRKDGSTFPVQLVVTVIRDERGEISGYLGIATDISDQVKARQEVELVNSKLKEASEQLNSQNKKLADFAHIIAHNLRSPLNNLQGLMSLYKELPVEEREIIIHKLEDVIENFSSTLNTLLDILRTKSDKNLVIEEIEVEKVYEKTLKLIDNPSDDIIITADFSEAPSLQYSAVYLESILLNLISNAIKYRDPDRPLQIMVKTQRNQEGKTMLLVKDNGLGIDLDKHRKHLFELNKTFHHHKDAKGVGLYMTRNQIEALGGKITAESQPGVGSTFIVTF